MAAAKTTKLDMPEHAIVLERSARASRQRAQATDASANPTAGFAGKSWGELTQPAKDNLLKALALEAGLIEPDPD